MSTTTPMQDTEQSTSDQAETACCPPSEQASCCEPADKATCCGDEQGPASCGCQ